MRVPNFRVAPLYLSKQQIISWHHFFQIMKYMMKISLRVKMTLKIGNMGEIRG